jgi:hypothetical protein
VPTLHVAHLGTILGRMRIDMAERLLCHMERGALLNHFGATGVV